MKKSVFTKKDVFRLSIYVVSLVVPRVLMEGIDVLWNWETFLFPVVIIMTLYGMRFAKNKP